MDRKEGRGKREEGRGKNYPQKGLVAIYVLCDTHHAPDIRKELDGLEYLSIAIYWLLQKTVMCCVSWTQ